MSRIHSLLARYSGKKFLTWVVSTSLVVWMLETYMGSEASVELKHDVMIAGMWAVAAIAAGKMIGQGIADHGKPS